MGDRDYSSIKQRFSWADVLRWAVFGPGAAASG